MFFLFFFFKQKTAYEMRISDWSSDVCSSDLPKASQLVWSGEFEYLERAKARLTIVIPVTAALIFLLLYLNFRRLSETLIVMLSLPFALTGGLWLMYYLGYNFSVAVAVGFIAQIGRAHV